VADAPTYSLECRFHAVRERLPTIVLRGSPEGRHLEPSPLPQPRESEKRPAAYHAELSLAKREAPLRISFKCPRCGGPHHVDRCDAPRAA
jgi:hypothetical protein